MEFPKDEVKNKVVWTKGTDFTDGSPRYTFEGRDPATTYERFQVVIYTEMERRYAHDPGSLCNHYYGYVRDDKMECAETIGPYYSVREAKQKIASLLGWLKDVKTEISAPQPPTLVELLSAYYDTRNQGAYAARPKSGI